MHSFLQEFKTFAMRGNVIDLAIAVIIGTAFGKITTALVSNIVMPLIGVLLGGVRFANLQTTVGNSTITYGIFLQAVVDFIIIALVVFLFIKLLNNLKKTEAEKPEEEQVVEPSEEVVLLREIRDRLG